MEKEKIGTPAIEDRKRRLEFALKILRARKRTPMPKAVALLSFNLGLSDRKAKEYIKTLVQIDGIKLEKDQIVRRD